MELNKQAKHLLQQIANVERSQRRCVNRRLELLQELKDLEIEEKRLASDAHSKKEELRKITGEVPKRSSTTSKPVHPHSLALSQRRLSLRFIGKEEHNTNSDVIQSDGVQLIRLKTPPKMVEAIDYEDGFHFSPKLQRTSPKLYELISNSGLSIKSPLKLAERKVLATLMGPKLPDSKSSLEDPPEETYKKYVSARTISTYPKVQPEEDRRDGDPICDRFGVQVQNQRIIACIADGCNWGIRPHTAAVKATDNFIKFMNQHNFTSLKEAGQQLMRAVSSAHNSIIEGLDDVWEAGTTTLMGGVLIRLKRRNKKLADMETDPKWAFVCVSVGDCKAFHWSKRTKKLMDITEGNRTSLTDATDPGGRIGPFLPGGVPDLRNLDLYAKPCEDGDIIFLVSDGVHDCFDPQHVGKKPSDFPESPISDFSDWHLAEEAFPEDVEIVKSRYRLDKMLKEIYSNSPVNSTENSLTSSTDINNNSSNTVNENNEENSVKSKELNPSDISARLLSYCASLTASSRHFMENYPNKRIPKNYEQFPGKMDHTTVVAFRVKSYESKRRRSATYQ